MKNEFSSRIPCKHGIYSNRVCEICAEVIKEKIKLPTFWSQMMNSLLNLIMFIVWIGGVIIAKGFWSTFFAFIIPFYAWYLVIEHILVKYNLL